MLLGAQPITAVAWSWLLAGLVSCAFGLLQYFGADANFSPWINQTRYGLSSSIFTRDANTAFRAMREFETGIVYVNAGTTGAETHLPFGGWKETGNGHREAGHAALDTYTEWKSVYVDFSGKLQRAQIDNQP